jgi:ribosomal protein L20
MTRHKQFKKAKDATLHAGQYAYDGRKLKKRDFRSLWIVRQNAALRRWDLPTANSSISSPKRKWSLTESAITDRRRTSDAFNENREKVNDMHVSLRMSYPDMIRDPPVSLKSLL